MKQPNRTFDKGNGVLRGAAAAHWEKRKQINLRTRANEDEQGDDETGWPGVKFGEVEVMKLQLYREATWRRRGREQRRADLSLICGSLTLFHRSESDPNSCSSFNLHHSDRENPDPSSRGVLKPI